MAGSPENFSNRPGAATAAAGDPLSEVVSLLRPRAVFANLITGKGSWSVRYAEYGLPSFCIALAGRSRLEVDGALPLFLHAGDFVLLPVTPAFTLSGGDPAPPVYLDPRKIAATPTTELRYGDQHGEPEMRSLGGAFEFGGSNPQMLVSLLPPVVHIRDAGSLSLLVAMVRAESSEQLPGRNFMLSRLVELMLVEAMRQTTVCNAPAGLLRGLGDARLAPALAQMHAMVDHPWSIGELARIAALSRSAFHERFTQNVGKAPMEYLQSWRMEIAKQLLRGEGVPVSEVAIRVGYGSTSAFSVAFSKQVGQSPARYARGPATLPGSDQR